MHQIAIFILTLIYSPSCLPQNNGRTINKIALENNFIETIFDETIIPMPPDSCYIKSIKNIYVVDRGSFMLEDVRSATYAVLSHGRMQPVTNWNWPKESVMTLLTTPTADGNIIIDIDHIKYGFKKVNYKIRLSSFLSSCIKDGCIPYVGIEAISDEAVTASLFLVNTDQQYNHVLKLCIPKQVVINRCGHVTGTIHTFIPMDNVAELYAK